MATRANIAIVLNSEDRDKPLNFMSDRFKEVRPLLEKNLAEEVQEKCNFVDIMSHKVLQIYNHHDGYPDHLGYILKKYYNTYEKALALILAGDTSFVNGARLSKEVVEEVVKNRVDYLCENTSVKYGVYTDDEDVTYNHLVFNKESEL